MRIFGRLCPPRIGGYAIYRQDRCEGESGTAIQPEADPSTEGTRSVPQPEASRRSRCSHPAASTCQSRYRPFGARSRTRVRWPDGDQPAEFPEFIECAAPADADQPRRTGCDDAAPQPAGAPIQPAAIEGSSPNRARIRQRVCSSAATTIKPTASPIQTPTP